MQNHSPRLGNLLLFIAILAVLIVATMMFGAQFDLWEPIVGFALIRQYMNPIAYFVITIGVLGLVHQILTGNRFGALKSCITCLLGITLLAPFIYQQIQPPVRFPPIHDITTDTVNPPDFLVIDEDRAGARNSLVYGGSEIALQQFKHYPDIGPIQSELSATQAYSKALQVAANMEWEMVAQDDDNLRFEASARTRLYRFIDDVVVVVTPEGHSSRVDIRSVSRIGRGDRGVNAMRIRAFIDAFNKS
tara:strand:- start:2672 stop:3412 length:741 start_codon:yes stop_codon:yes gene_type:complete